MGRIEEALMKSRRTAPHGGKLRRDSGGMPLTITRRVDLSTENIDFASLTKVKPSDSTLAKHRIVAAQPDASARSLYKVLRTRLLQRLRSNQWNIVGISGTGPGEGKTLTAINLAYSLAQDVNHRVVLVDLDLRRPSIHEYLGIHPRKDLTNYFTHGAKLENILVNPGIERMAVLTNQTPHRESSEILSSPELGDLIAQLKGLGPQTITLVDLPPILAGDDVLAFAPLVDAMLLVVSEGKCKRDDLVQAQELLQDANILGTILNNSRDKPATSSYYDYY